MTLVELLVTIVISTLFFAALVPVFVFAQKQSSGDRARVIAANVAQAKLETVRSVDYTLLDEDAAYFISSDGVAAGFGSTFPNEEGGPVKTYTIDYDVDFVYSSDNPSEVVYKLVTVDVYWAGPPKPVKHVILKTAVYPQYKGPEIADMTVQPLATVGVGEEAEQYIPAVPVTIAAQIEGVDVERTDYVRFAVSATNGSYVEVQDVSAAQAVDGLFTWVWPGSDAGDGEYLFRAVGVSTEGRLGESWKLQYVLETGPPDAPRSVAGQGGDNVVVLSWLPPDPVAGDLGSYTIRRSDGEEFAGLSKRSTTFVDRSVTNGTSYTYTVCAVDTRGNVSVDSAPVTMTPAIPLLDTTAPTAPSGLTAILIGQSVRLQWNPNAVSEAVVKYRVYRSDDSLFRSPIAVIDTNTTYTIYSYTDPEIGWNSPSYTYYVAAVDAALNESAKAQTGAMQTPTAPPEDKYSLTVKVKGADALVMVASLVDGSVYDTSGNRVVGDKHVAQEFVQSSNKKGVTFNNLPYATYRITVTFVNKQRVPIAEPLFRDVELARRDEPSIDFTY